MTGQATWLSLIVILVPVALGALFWLRTFRDARHYTSENTTVRCRQRGNQLAEVAVARDAHTGAPVGILSCSLEPGVVRCNRACLPLLRPAEEPAAEPLWPSPYGL